MDKDLLIEMNLNDHAKPNFIFFEILSNGWKISPTIFILVGGYLRPSEQFLRPSESDQF
jgi:hypothetical protein